MNVYSKAERKTSLKKDAQIVFSLVVHSLLSFFSSIAAVVCRDYELPYSRCK